jgi:4-alpha-glucanotransferase
MTKSVSLLFGVHAHQPAGNFESVLDDAHARCYKPFLETLHRYPDFRFAVHFSGWLLDYLLRSYPQDMEKLAAMVARGQVEMFGGGDTEPVLASIPEHDRRSQLSALADRIESAFGQRPSGAWLTERVWESAVGPSLAGSGIRYVTVDDYHFLCAGRRSSELTGHFSTEEGGVRLDLFPIAETLRYQIPFSKAADAVRHLESLATEDGNAAAIYFDDIEKLGIWPETYKWVYEQRWLEQFIEGVLASPQIVSGHYRDYHETRATRGVVYLPTTSYIEMNEWTLDADREEEFAALVAHEKSIGRYDARKPFIRGGIWRNFLSRYSESNWMHKRMLQLSARLEALPTKKVLPEMRELIHLAQANDAYWHGLFGGLYLPHLRRAVWNSIVALEALLDAASPRRFPDAADCDLDGCRELFLCRDGLQAVMREDGWGAIHELDHYPLRHNFADSLMRRTEHYYRKILGGAESAHDGDGIASAHDRVRFRHPVTAEDLVPDAAPRALFIDHLLRGDSRIPVRYALGECAANRAVWRSEEEGLTKTVTIEDGSARVHYAFDRAPADIETALNLAMPSCDGFLGRFVVEGEVAGGFGEAHQWPSLARLKLEDGVLRGQVTLDTDGPAAFASAPHHTVSQSEDGFEKVMQAVCVTLRLPARAETTVTLSIGA